MDGWTHTIPMGRIHISTLVNGRYQFVPLAHPPPTQSSIHSSLTLSRPMRSTSMLLYWSVVVAPVLSLEVAGGWGRRNDLVRK